MFRFPLYSTLIIFEYQEKKPCHELTAALDPETSQEVMDLLLMLKNQERIIIIATHNPVIWEKADEVVKLN